MSEDQQNVGLMLGERMNWQYILGVNVLKLDDSLVREEGFQSEQQVREAVLSLYDKIPKAWKDDEWNKDMEEAFIEVTIDLRPIWCGVRVGEPKFRKEKKVRPHRMYRAIVNLFNRRGMLSKRIFQENMVPTPEQLETLVEEII